LMAHVEKPMKTVTISKLTGARLFVKKR
jgi:hypothetical protein